MKRLSRSIVILLCSLFAINSFASEVIRNEIKQQMAQRHPEPSAAFWTNLGSNYGTEVLSVIKEMYGETKNPIERTWLIDGMGYFSDASVAALLQSEIKNTKNQILKKKMLGALIQSQGEQAFDFVEPFLEDADPHVRLETARAMKQYMQNTQARARVEKFEQGEKLDWVKVAAKKEISAESRLRKSGMVLQKKTPHAEASPTPLPEKAWAGEWKGVYIGAKKSTSAHLFLSLVNEKASAAEQKWKVELKLPRQTKVELKGKEIEIVYYQSAHLHWLEVRNLKQDAVFVGKRQP